MRRPSLAMAAKAFTIWIPVTEISWPIDMVASDSPDQRAGGRSWPRLSPGRSMRLGLPKPKLVMYW